MLSPFVQQVGGLPLRKSGRVSFSKRARRSWIGGYRPFAQPSTKDKPERRPSPPFRVMTRPEAVDRSGETTENSSCLRRLATLLSLLNLYKRTAVVSFLNGRWTRVGLFYDLTDVVVSVRRRRTGLTTLAILLTPKVQFLALRRTSNLGQQADDSQSVTHTDFARSLHRSLNPATAPEPLRR